MNTLNGMGGVNTYLHQFVGLVVKLIVLCSYTSLDSVIAKDSPQNKRCWALSCLPVSSQPPRTILVRSTKPIILPDAMRAPGLTDALSGCLRCRALGDLSYCQGRISLLERCGRCRALQDWSGRKVQWFLGDGSIVSIRSWGYWGAKYSSQALGGWSSFLPCIFIPSLPWSCSCPAIALPDPSRHPNYPSPRPSQYLHPTSSPQPTLIRLAASSRFRSFVNPSNPSIFCILFWTK